eukprot:m.2711 g.2711  ORF g.2711 m.2711 type:complete len:67 (-) comp2573_c0_seq1:57-257(-)
MHWIPSCQNAFVGFNQGSLKKVVTKVVKKKGDTYEVVKETRGQDGDFVQVEQSVIEGDNYKKLEGS